MDNVGTQVTTGVQTGQTDATAQQAQVVTQQVQQQPVNNVQQYQGSQALFTQEQLNSIISGRINPLNTKINELNNQLAQSQQLANSYLSELNGYKNRETAVKAGVPAQFVDFAVFEASKLAVNGKSFEDAMKEYVSKNSSLFGNTTQASQCQPEGTPAQGKTTQGVATPAQTQQAQQITTQVTNTQQAQAQGVVQMGGTGVATAGAMTTTGNIDAEVQKFLKDNKLIK